MTKKSKQITTEATTRTTLVKKVVLVASVGLLAIVGWFGYKWLMNRETTPERPVVKIAIIPSEDVNTMYQKQDKWVAFVEESTDIDIELVEAEDYSAVVNALKYGHIDIGRLGAFSYVLAREETPVEPFLVSVKTSTGSAYYQSYIIVRTDSGITDIGELEGKIFGYVDLASTSGYLYPKYALLSAGVDINDEDAILTGSHPASVLAVKNGTIDAAGIASNRYDQAIKEGVIEEGEFTVIYESEDIPTTVWVTREGFDNDMLDKIEEAMMNVPADAMEATGYEESGYEPVEDSYFDVIRRLVEKLNLDLEKME